MYFKLFLPKVFSIFTFPCFPKDKICHWFFFILVIIDTYGWFHSRHIEMCKISIFFELLDTIIDTSIICKIGKSSIQHRLYHTNHFWDDMRHWHDILWKFDLEFFEVFKKYFRIFLREIRKFLPCFHTISDGFIIYIGYIHRYDNLVS